MTLPSRHRIRNLRPGGLRPSTLPLGYRGSPQWCSCKGGITVGRARQPVSIGERWLRHRHFVIEILCIRMRELSYYTKTIDSFAGLVPNAINCFILAKLSGFVLGELGHFEGSRTADHGGHNSCSLCGIRTDPVWWRGRYTKSGSDINSSVTPGSVRTRSGSMKDRRRGRRSFIDPDLGQRPRSVGVRLQLLPERPSTD